jgi:hypothetical protein
MHWNSSNYAQIYLDIKSISSKINHHGFKSSIIAESKFSQNHAI